jgi:hypothetical protein
LTSRLQSFETEVLAQEENLAGLAALNRELIAKAEAIDSSRRVVLDMEVDLQRAIERELKGPFLRLTHQLPSSAPPHAHPNPHPSGL